MTKVVGVRFRQVGKIYFLHLGNIQSKQDSMLLLRLPEELEYGQVVLGEREVEDTAVIQPLKAIIRIATPEDDERELKTEKRKRSI